MTPDRLAWNCAWWYSSIPDVSSPLLVAISLGSPMGDGQNGVQVDILGPLKHIKAFKVSRVRAPVLCLRVLKPVLRHSKGAGNHASAVRWVFYTRIGSMSHINADPQSLIPLISHDLKLFFNFTSYFGCFLMCILYWPSGGCYFIETVSAQSCPYWFVSIY